MPCAGWVTTAYVSASPSGSVPFSVTGRAVSCGVVSVAGVATGGWFTGAGVQVRVASAVRPDDVARTAAAPAVADVRQYVALPSPPVTSERSSVTTPVVVTSTRAPGDPGVVLVREPCRRAQLAADHGRTAPPGRG